MPAISSRARQWPDASWFKFANVFPGRPHRLFELEYFGHNHSVASIPDTSVMDVTLRVPSRKRDCLDD